MYSLTMRPGNYYGPNESDASSRADALEYLQNTAFQITGIVIVTCVNNNESQTVSTRH